jgi:hypothetical protein
VAAFITVYEQCNVLHFARSSGDGHALTFHLGVGVGETYRMSKTNENMHIINININSINIITVYKYKFYHGLLASERSPSPHYVHRE